MGFGKSKGAPKKWATGIGAVDHILNGDLFGPLLGRPDSASILARWRDELRIAIQHPPRAPELAAAFHDQWHVCHHFLREIIDDDHLMTDTAWAWLPRYAGPDRVLFRGENIDRTQAGRIGAAWSDRREVAQMFAEGLNAVGRGSTLLRVHAPAAAIIAGPSAHSIYLGESEFTVDWRALANIEQCQSFAPRTR